MSLNHFRTAVFQKNHLDHSTFVR